MYTCTYACIVNFFFKLAQQPEDPHGMRGPHPHASMPVLSDDELSSDSESDTEPEIPSGMHLVVFNYYCINPLDFPLCVDGDICCLGKNSRPTSLSPN